MKKILIGIIILALLLIIGIIALPSLVPSSVYQEKIETQLSQELGRKVSVLGDIKLSAFPVIKANTGRVEIENPEGFQAEKFAAMDAMSARVKLLPLLSKRVEISAFTLKNPVINLEKTAKGEVNWAFGDAKQTPAKIDAGPFKRDGRYAALDPAIGKFALENGSINYSDFLSGKSHNLKDVNLNFALSSLSAPLEIDGNLIYNGSPADIDLSLDSVRAFLDGKDAQLSLTLKTDFADISSKGKFLAGEDIRFNLDVDGDISDVTKLSKLSPVEIPYAELAKSIKLSGNYGYDGTVVTAKNADITLTGSSFNAGFKGGATLAQSPVFDGRVSLDAQDIKTLAKALKLDIKGLDLVETAKFTADLKAQGKGFAANNIDAVLKGDGLTASYTGSAIISDKITANGAFAANAASLPNLVNALALDIPQAAAVQNLDAKGTIDYAGDTITLGALDVKTEGGAVAGTYEGTAKITEGTPTLAGNFKVDIPSVAQANQIAGLNIDAANGVGSVYAAGQINMTGKNISVSDLIAETKGDIINGQYKGSATLGGVTGYEGSFNTTLTALNEFSKRTNITVPYADAIGQIDIQGNISGQGETLQLSSLNAALTDGQINGQFTGTASLNNGLNLDGDLSADIPSLRNIAQTAGNNALPPSTNAGPIYERFTAAGKVTGTPSEIAFKSAAIGLDAMKGQGNFTVDLTKAKPFISGTLDMEDLDLRPYMAAYSAQKPTGKIQPWSEAPINVAPLKTVDGNFTLNTPNIITDRMSLGQSNISAKLRNGVMSADLPNMALYGGLGRMSAVIDGSGTIPVISLDMGLDKLESNSFLGAAAGFTNATGEMGSAFKIRGSGRTQAQIMKSLSGGGDFKMLNGQIAGVDLGTMLTGLDQAFTAKTLPGGIGPSHVTKFKDILGLFTIENGVAKIGKFSLDGAGVLAEGAGQIDLGNQKIDFSLRPRLTGESASNLAAFGIPIQVKGGFGDVKIGLDSDLLGDIVAERARIKAGNLIKEQVGGGLGDILGGVIGGQQPSQAPSTNTQTPPNETATPAPTKEEAVTDLLGGLLGVKKAPTQPQPQPQPQSQPSEPAPESPKTEEPQKEEPKLEDALLSIFGGKKE